MNILIVTDVFPPYCGGAGWSTYYLSKALRDKGHDITIVRAGKSNKKEIYDGLTVYHARHDLGNEFVHKAIEHTILGLMKTNKFDLIHAQHMRSARAIKNITNIPKTCTVRDHWPICYKGTMFCEKEGKICNTRSYFHCAKCIFQENKGIIKLLSPAVAAYMKYRTNDALKSLQSMNKVICVSNYVKQMLLPHINSEKLEVIHNMIDIKKINKIKKQTSKSERKEFVFVGKFEVNKGILMLADAISALDDVTKSKTTFTLIGDGSLKEKVRKQLQDSNVHFEIKDYLPNEKVLEIVKSSYAFMSTSLLHDTLSRGILEAMACETGIIATNIGGTSDMIKDKFNGLLVEPNSDALKTAIENLTENEKQRDRFANKAHEIAKKKFDFSVLVKQYEMFYKNLAK
jgi:glycogen(starch) synthase